MSSKLIYRWIGRHGNKGNFYDPPSLCERKIIFIFMQPTIPLLDTVHYDTFSSLVKKN